MAFEDYGAIPESHLKRAREIYENQEKGENKEESKYEKRPEKFSALKDTPVKTKKYSLMEKISDVFFVNSPQAAREHVFTDIFVPQMKDMMMNMIWGYFSSFFYDTPMAAPRGRNRADMYHGAFERGTGKISRDRGGPQRTSSDTRSIGYRRMADDLIFDDMGEATEFLDILREYVERYGVLSIGDVYDTAGLSHSYTDDKYGWKSLAGANVHRLGRDQYTIYFPKAEPI